MSMPLPKAGVLLLAESNSSDDERDPLFGRFLLCSVPLAKKRQEVFSNRSARTPKSNPQKKDKETRSGKLASYSSRGLGGLL